MATERFGTNSGRARKGSEMIRSISFAVFLAVAVMVAVDTVIADAPATQPAPTWHRPRLVGWASDSGRFSLDEAKLRGMFPDFAWTTDQIAYLNEHLDRGDSRAAIVASVKPLVVSAYSDELDAVILVQFPDALVDKYSLGVGDPLIASWIYPSLRQPPSDIVQGPNNLKRYNNGAPLVADFFSNSVDKIKQRKLGVSKDEWARVLALTPDAVKRADGKYRSGFPLDTRLPPELLDKWRVQR